MPNAITLYLLHLNPESRGTVDRYAVMRLNADGGMSPLWGQFVAADPGDDAAWNRASRKGAKAWPHMVYQARPASGPDRYPAFHFKLDGGGYSKPYQLADSLANALGWPVDLYPVNGWASSPQRATPRKAGSRKAALAKLEGASR